MPPAALDPPGGGDVRHPVVCSVQQNVTLAFHRILATQNTTPKGNTAKTSSFPVKRHDLISVPLFILRPAEDTTSSLCVVFVTIAHDPDYVVDNGDFFHCFARSS